MATESLDLDRWETEFLRVRGSFDSFTQELRRLLEQLLKADRVLYAQLEARTKDAEGFRSKLERKGEKYANPLTDVTDLSGLRVILYYPADVSVVGNLVEREFRVDWDNSVRQGAATDPDRFGYRSDHYVVWVSEDRCRRPEWRAVADKRAEIQVRTVMQHAWAAVDHRMRYKGTQVLPRDLRRRLYRLSALLEVADDQFAALQEASIDLASSYRRAIAAGDLDLPIDALSLSAFVDEEGAAWKQRAEAAGWEAVPDVFEQVSKTRAKRIEDLVTVLHRLGLETIADYRVWLVEAAAWAEEVYVSVLEKTAKYAAEHPPEDPPTGWGGIMGSRGNALLVLAHVALGDAEFVGGEGWRADVGVGIIESFEIVPQGGPAEPT